MATIAICLIAAPAYAQEISSPPSAPAPANLAFVDGTVDVVQSGVTEPADPPMMLIEGDIVRSRNGRAEIVFGDGTLLHLAADSEVEILGEERLRLLSGRAIVRVSHAAARPYVIDTPASAVRLEAQGEYGITSDRSGRLEVAVARGAATVDDGQPWSIRGGQVLGIRGRGGRPLIAAYNSARWDAFETWSHDRANGFASSASAAQLPYELRAYGPVLDRYGRWDYVAPHGYVWFPSVGATWRPYYDGSWAFTRYGWTWHGRDRWAWPTHHYGRWGFNGMFWFWIPAATWAPAWVTWSVTGAYVSWAPLGWYSPRYDIWGRRDHPAYAPHYNPWRGWTVLPRNQFGPRRNVRSYAIDAERLDDAARRVMLANALPNRPEDDVAVPRGWSREPGARGGNVRRLPPDTGGSRGRSEPAPLSRTRPDDPSYAPPASWSGTADRVGQRDDRGTAAKPAPREYPRGTSRGTPDARGGDDGARRGGAVRAPAAAPPRAPGSEGARQPQSRGGDAAAGAAGAVGRGSGARPKG